MTVKADVRYVNSKRDKTKKVKKTTYKCEGSYVDIDGVPHRYHKRGFSTSEEAKEWERSFLLETKSIIPTSLTFNDLYIKYMQSKKDIIKERTYDDLQNTFKAYIIPFWGNIKLNEIRVDHIEKFQQHILEMKTLKGKPYSNAMIITIQTRLKSCFNYAFQNGYISNQKIISFKRVRRSDESIKEMRFWHPEEYNKFITIVDDKVYIALFNVLYWCGLRIGEALALRWSDINIHEKTITVSKTYTKHKRQTTTPKTKNSYRSVIMPDRCFTSIYALYEAHSKTIGFNEERYVFGFNKPLDDNSIRIKKDNWIKQAGVQRIRIHDFRHSHVSLLISLGFSPFDIAKRLGHTVEMVNEVYGHWFKDAQQKMVDKLNETSKNLV